mgnify:CR=1 FL=1
MRVKTVLWSLLLSYGLTGLFLLLLAFLLFQFELGEGAAAAGIVFIYVVSCLAGGFAAGRIMRKNRYLWNCYRAVLLCSTASGIFSGTGKMGYDFYPCSDYFFYVPGRRSHRGNAVVKACKKML